MPKSKKPRKKGRHGRDNATVKKWNSGKFSSVEDAEKAYKAVHAMRLRQHRACLQLGFMLTFLDRGELIDSFLRSTMAVDRFPTTKDFNDFNSVSSSLMLGILLHVRMGVEEQELKTEMQNAAFMCVVCVRLRNYRKPVPPENLEAIKNGLATAQSLMEYAYDNDRQALIEVLKENDSKHVENTPGLLEAHERLILGRNYDRVREWEEEDDKAGRLRELHN